MIWLVAPLMALAADLCNIKIHAPEHIDFSENEQKLICGDPSTAEWKKIPPSQQISHLTAILQSKGFHNPKVEREKNQIRVQLQHSAKVRKIVFVGIQPSEDLRNNTTYLGEKLTPKLLDQIEKMTRFHLSTQGHVCPKVTSHANPQTEIVEVSVAPGAIEKFRPVSEVRHKELLQQALQRNYAFNSEIRYDRRRLEISSRRILNKKNVAFTRFNPECDSEMMQHQTILGKPKVIQIGLGLNSDIGPFASLKWMNTRLSKMASTVRAAIRTSWVEQKSELSGNFYLIPASPRIFVEPRWRVVHSKERAYESLENKLSTHLGKKWDFNNVNFKTSIGPSYSVSEIFDGIGPRKSRYGALGYSVSLWDYDFEYYQFKPRQGFKFDANINHTDPGWDSSFTATRIKFSGTFLKNFSSYTPERFIFSLRFNFSHTFYNKDKPLADLPLEFRHFAGGSTDIRGYARNALPFEGQGALSKAYLGMELRNNSLFGYGLQPFLFLDLLGIAERSLDAKQFPQFSAPGVGLRWQSPIGVFRGTYARGNSLRTPQKANDQLHLTYGEEF